MDARAIDQLSITYYGRRTMNINLPSIDDLDQAQYIADFERNRRKTPFGLAQTITLQSHAELGGARHEDQLQLTVGSLVRLQETQTDHEGTYFVIGEAHELARGVSTGRRPGIWSRRSRPCPGSWKIASAASWMRRLTWRISDRFSEMRRLATGRASSH